MQRVCGWVRIARTRRQILLRTFSTRLYRGDRSPSQNTYTTFDDDSFDPGTLAILKRFDDLEGLLTQARHADPLSPPVVLPTNPNPSTPSSVPRSDLSSSSSVVDAWTRGKRPLVGIEAVLQWPSFREHGLPSRLYPTPQSKGEAQPSDPTTWRVSVGMELPAAEGVLRRFFDNFHIFNPILEEEEVRNYINTVQFEGIGWDGVSCLVVTNISPMPKHGQPLQHSSPDHSSSSSTPTALL